ESGTRETEWPARLQFMQAHGGWPDVLLDVAHNPAGAWALRSAISERFRERRLVFVFGAMRGKALAEMAEILSPLGERVIATRASGHNPRAAAPQEIVDAAARLEIKPETSPSVAAALGTVRGMKDELVVVTGSIYVVGEAMEA